MTDRLRKSRDVDWKVGRETQARYKPLPAPAQQPSRGQTQFIITRISRPRDPAKARHCVNSAGVSSIAFIEGRLKC